MRSPTKSGHHIPLEKVRVEYVFLHYFLSLPKHVSRMCGDVVYKFSHTDIHIRRITIH